MIPRRRILTISAGALVCAVGAGTRTGAGGESGTITRHRFRALGADCVLTLPARAGNADTERAAGALAAVRDEIERIESVFSLWQPESELSRLNRIGRLSAPGADFLRVHRIAAHVSWISGGVFDPTVQPVWEARAAGRPVDWRLIDWRLLEVGPTSAVFRRPGMAATFNGIAQGYAADRAVRVLENFGYGGVLANLGEFRGAGVRPDGIPWRIGVAAPQSMTKSLAGSTPGTARLRPRPKSRIIVEIALSGAASAVAVSEPRGALVGGFPHIVDPRAHNGSHDDARNGAHIGPRWASVAVAARTAALADALSTTVAAAPEAMAGTILERGPAAGAALIAKDGAVTLWPPARGRGAHWRIREG